VGRAASEFSDWKSPSRNGPPRFHRQFPLSQAGGNQIRTLAVVGPVCGFWGRFRTRWDCGLRIGPDARQSSL